nr:PREDICTED: uncharacterized protein LOC106702918 [Latimeria chalumnae]|eukprot:XP_014342082.1 PREDICTED: uncharacterized protein LOC106702918 [Latimeria chalumnae]
METKGCKKGAVILCILLVAFSYQVLPKPILSQVSSSLTRREGSSSAVSTIDSIGPQILRRWVRMTPFWRTVGSKPYGAYCQNDYECTTKLCRKGHCAYHVSFES